MKKYLGFIALVLVGTMLISCSVLPGALPGETSDLSEPEMTDPIGDYFIYPAFVCTSYEELCKFVTAASGTENQFNQYVDGLGYSFSMTYDEAVRIKDYVTAQAIPVLPSSDYFNMAFYTADSSFRTKMCLDYRDGPRLYNFEYWFDYDEGPVLEGVPDMMEVPFGDETVDLYAKGPYYEGEIVKDNTRIYVEVDIGAFDKFEFVIVPDEIG